MAPSLLPVIFSFWHGPLSWLERLSIQSFLHQGHRFVLYSYERPSGLPHGCEWRDAAEVLPRDQMFFYKNGRTPATFADLFRLAVMRTAEAIWVDCDVICLQPFRNLDAYVFGYETASHSGHRWQINNAVLRLPKDSPLLDALLRVFEGDETRVDPVWMPRYRRFEIAIRRLMGKNPGLGDFQFGATGPFPLTYYAQKLDLDRHALPVEVFYPLPYKAAPTMLEAGSRFERFTRENSLAVHLWRMALTDRSRTPVPPLPSQDSALAVFARAIGAPIEKA